MAKMEPIRGEITVKLSSEDRKLLRGIATALGVPPEEAASFADTTRRLVELPPAEGDWLLETERAEAGDDVD